jgi:hypothetical protein
MAQATPPPVTSPVAAIRPLEEAINGLRHSQNILVAALGIVAALFLGALVWLASDIGGLRQQVTGIETRMETGLDAVDARVSTGFDTINSRIDGLTIRMDTTAEALNSRIDGLNARVDNLVAAVGEFRTEIGAIGAKLDEIGRSSPNRAALD